MTTWRILDLETAAHPDATQWVDPVKADSRLVDPAKIEKSIQDKTEQQKNEFGLDPDCCRLVALGYFDIGTTEPTVYLMRNEFEEREQLKLFWSSYRHDTRLVTFNGIRFDLPVLIMRSLYLQVEHPPLVIAPAWKTPHVDLWSALSLDGARRDVHSLAFYARRFGFGTLDKVHGSQMQQLVNEERWNEIHDHCLSDIGLTHALANRLGILKVGVAA